MKRATRLLMLMIFAVACAGVRGQDAPSIKIGDAAPKLSVSEWINGEPIGTFEAGKVYVVDFWATWCGPCRVTIPNLNALQVKHAKDGLIVIGLNVWEGDGGAVKSFIKEMGEKMTYRVGIDEGGKSGVTAAAWLRAAGKDIPCSFVVDQKGNVAWAGTPGPELDEVVGKVLAGKYNAVEVAKEKDTKERLQAQFLAAMQQQRWDAALRAIDGLAKIEPEAAGELGMVKFHILVKGKKDFDAAYKLARKLGDEEYKNDSESLNALSWTILTDEEIEKRDVKLAFELAQRAAKLTEFNDAAILDTLARAYFDSGDVVKAVELQVKAVEKADETIKAELEETLARYRKARAIQ